jgi:hypothetical protein
MADGLSGIFMEPYNGAKRDGVKGFFKGVGTGSIAGVTTKVGSGNIIRVSFPSESISTMMIYADI